MHAIDETTGQAAVMTAGELPWHRLGVNVAEAQDSENTRKLSLTNFTVSKQPLKYTFNGELKTALDRFAIVRSDTGAMVGDVGPAYTPFQNHEATELLDSLHDEGVKYETAGAILDGAIVWYLMKIPTELRIPGTDDVTRAYMLASLGHDGKHALDFFPTAVRVVCWNTHQMAFHTRAEKGTAQHGYHIRHYKTLPDRVKVARKGLRLVKERFATYQEEMEALASVSMTGTEVTEYFANLLPKPKKERGESAVDTLRDAGLLESIIEAAQGQKDVIETLLAADSEEASRAEKNNKKILDILVANFEKREFPQINGTPWKAFNSVTDYVDHIARTRGSSDRERNENRMLSAVFGKGNDMKEQAFQNALEFVKLKRN